MSVCAERLVESLRLPQVPILHAQVFLFFRVLLLRMSPQHLTSLWPTMITELVSSTRRSFPALVFVFSLILTTFSPAPPSGAGVPADGAGAHSGRGHIKVCAGSAASEEHPRCLRVTPPPRPDAGRQVRLWPGWRPPTPEGTASLRPTTASAGSTSTCLPASCWTWLWPCPLRTCLSSRCQYQQVTCSAHAHFPFQFSTSSTWGGVAIATASQNCRGPTGQKHINSVGHPGDGVVAARSFCH